jgi:uncharacterized coiled-coil protein SlyX
MVMEYPRLFRLLRDDHNRHEMQVGAIEQAICALTAVVGEVLQPDQKEALDKISAQLGNDLNKVRVVGGTMLDYFSGHGPVAKRLREHLLLIQWLYDTSEVPKEVSDQLVGSMMRKIDSFDFKPSQEIGDIKEAAEFYNFAIDQVAQGYFTAPFPKIPEGTHGPELFQTGLYGSPGGGQQLTLVLRVGQPGEGGMQSVFMASPGSVPMLWHHHPWEDYWMSPAHFETTFPGLIEAMREQLALALANATGDTSSFDLAKELQELTVQANTIFDSELLLPEQVLHSDNNAVYLAYNDQQSEILARTADHILSFMNTKGEFPIRSGPRLFSLYYLNPGTRTVNWNDLPVAEQQTLMARARASMALLISKVNEASSGANTPYARKSLAAYHEVPPPGPLN